jgi:hypothetical protein
MRHPRCAGSITGPRAAACSVSWWPGPRLLIAVAGVPACPGPAAGVFGWAKGYATVAYNAATGARLWATHYRNKQH